MDARRDHDQAQKVDATLRQEMQSSARPCLTQRWHGFSSSHFTLDLRQTAHASEIVCRFRFTAASGARRSEVVLKESLLVGQAELM